MCVILYDSYVILRIDDISLDFKINRCSIRLLENQTVTDATGRERLMTLKDYNIKENNVIAMVMKDHTTTNLNGYDENERIVFLFFHFRYRGSHIELCHLGWHTLLGGHTVECIIWSLVDTHWSVTFSFGLNHIRLQHFHMIQHVKRCSLMWFNPRLSFKL